MTEIRFSAQQVADVLGIPFSEDQLKAIAAEMTPAVIVAGAGSGKTAVMTARVVYLVANGFVPADQVLGLTFTNLATGELQSRVRDALNKLAVSNADEDKAETGEPTVSTYHSFSGELLREFGIRIGIEPEHTLLSDVRRQQLAMRMLRSTNVSFAGVDMKFGTVLERLLKLDDAMSDFNIKAEQLIEFDEKLIREVEPSVTNEDGRKIIQASRNRILLTQLVQEFREFKKSYDCLDYADMTRLAIEVFQAQPDLVDDVRKRFSVVMLDEYQDTSTAQRVLMHTLFGNGHSLTAVGDGLQSIYVFRGANPQNIDNFRSHFAHEESIPAVLSLPETQRNGQNIVAIANALTDELRQPDAHPLALPLAAKANPTHGPGVAKLGFFESSNHEADWLADNIRQQEASGIKLSDIAVLLRRRDDVGWFYRALADRGINVQIRTKSDLLDVPEVAECVAYLRVIAEPTANEAWIRLLTGGRLRISNRDLKLIADAASSLVVTPHQRPTDLQGILDSTAQASDRITIVAYGDAIAHIAANGHPAMSESAVSRVRMLSSEISHLRRFTSEPLVDFVQRVLATTGLSAEANSHVSRVAAGMPGNLRAFVSMAADFVSLDGQNSLFAFLTWLEDARRLDSQGQMQTVVSGNAVQLMTVHSSKGLQFKCVAIPRLSTDIFPSKNGSDRWPTNPHVIPDELRPDVSDPVLTNYPPRGVRLTEAVLKPFAEACRRLDDLDERRLIYVAVTRAQQTLLVSAAHAIPGEKKSRVPSKFLVEMKSHFESVAVADVTVEQWFDAPSEQVELEDSALSAAWPVELNSEVMRSIREAADYVRALVATKDVSPVVSGLTDGAGLIKSWDRAIATLVEEFKNEDSRTEVVELPSTLSVSQIQRLNKDVDTYLADLLRPMPCAPAFAAQQGTDFHAWVELRSRAVMGQAQSAVLPGMEDFEELDFETTQNLEKFISNFENSEWSSRVPAAVEKPFVYSVAGRAIRGVIDAIYQESDGSWLLIDWKTNANKTADDLQLSIYRLAWARLQQCSVEQVRCAFYYAALDETVAPSRYYSEKEVAEILAEQN